MKKIQDIKIKDVTKENFNDFIKQEMEKRELALKFGNTITYTHTIYSNTRRRILSVTRNLFTEDSEEYKKLYNELTISLHNKSSIYNGGYDNGAFPDDKEFETKRPFDRRVEQPNKEVIKVSSRDELEIRGLNKKCKPSYTYE